MHGEENHQIIIYWSYGITGISVLTLWVLEQKCMKAWISSSNKNNCSKEPHICTSYRNH